MQVRESVSLQPAAVPRLTVRSPPPLSRRANRNRNVDGSIHGRAGHGIEASTCRLRFGLRDSDVCQGNRFQVPSMTNRSTGVTPSSSQNVSESVSPSIDHVIIGTQPGHPRLRSSCHECAVLAIELGSKVAHFRRTAFRRDEDGPSSSPSVSEKVAS